MFSLVIKSLELKNFRNYERLSIEPSPGTNLFYGENAQGKTNILESIYVCATTKSHRGNRDRDLIRFGAEDAHICMRIEKNQVIHKIDMHLKRSRPKGVAVDGMVVKKYAQLFGTVNVILFSPEDLAIIKNGPAERRRFADMELCQLNKIYMHQLAGYNKVLNQRNHLLRQIASDQSLNDTLDIWEDQLVRWGGGIIKARAAFIREIGVLVSEIHERLSGGRESLRIQYEPNISAEDFSSALSKKRVDDIRLKTTSVGPHRDDIRFEIDGVDIRKFGSQGQQRTAALSLKLAEIEMVRRVIHDCPVLLLDDVLSELDSNRQNFLLESIRDIQTMITCTGPDDFLQHHFDIDHIYRVAGGSAGIV